MAMLKSVSNLTSNSFNKISKKDLGNIGVVSDVILNEDSSLIPDLDVDDTEFTDKDTSYVGVVRVSMISDGILSSSEYQYAFPYDRNIMRLPLKNEVVELHRINGKLYYSLFESYFSPNITATNTLLNELENPTEFETVDPNKAGSYNRTIQTGIPRNTSIQDNDSGEFGDYYEGDPSIHRLRLFEGDILLESRFGQSIRFNGYDGENTDMNPTIFIRNNESGVSQSETPDGGLTDEDINRDGSSIVLSSGTRILDFIPGTVSDRESSDFKTSPDSITDYPSQFDGDQLLMSSGRVLISSRTDETLIFSKGNVGIISDENFSLDLRGGITANVDDTITITSGDNNVLVRTGNGHVELGSNNLEPIVKGDTLLTLLEGLVDAILQQTYATPSGPTSTGPLNQPEFRRIKSKLRDILGKNLTN